MHSYNCTNKLLFVLAIVNILMLIPTVWSLAVPISFLLTAKYNAYTIPAWINFIILPTGTWFLVLGITTWAFFKKMTWVIVFYLLYLSCKIPFFVRGEIQNRNSPIALHFFSPIVELGSTVDLYSVILLWLFVLIITIVMLFETNYKNIFNCWHR